MSLSKKQLHKWPWLAMCSVTLVFFALNLSATSLSLLLQQRGLEEKEAGAIFSAFPILSILTLVASSWAVSQWGGGWVAKCSVLLNVFCVIGYAMVDSLIGFVLTHGLHGIVTMFTLPTTVSHLRACCLERKMTPGQDTKCFARTMGAALLAGGLGYLLGNTLISKEHLTIWVLLASSSYICVFFLLRQSLISHRKSFKRTKARQTRSWNNLWLFVREAIASFIDRKVLLVSLMGFGVFGAYRAVFGFLPFQAGWNAGFLILIITVSQFVSATWVVPWLAEKWAQKKQSYLPSFWAGSILFVLAMPLLWAGLLTEESLLTYVACVLIGMGYCGCDIGLAQQAQMVSKDREASVPQREMVNEGAYAIIGFLFGGLVANVFNESMWLMMIIPIVISPMVVLTAKKIK